MCQRCRQVGFQGDAQAAHLRLLNGQRVVKLDLTDALLGQLGQVAVEAHEGGDGEADLARIILDPRWRLRRARADQRDAQAIGSMIIIQADDLEAVARQQRPELIWLPAEADVGDDKSKVLAGGVWEPQVVVRVELADALARRQALAQAGVVKVARQPKARVKRVDRCQRSVAVFVGLGRAEEIMVGIAGAEVVVADGLRNSNAPSPAPSDSGFPPARIGDPVSLRVGLPYEGPRQRRRDDAGR